MDALAPPTLPVLVERVRDECIPLPTAATAGSAGFDLRVCLDRDPITIWPGEARLLPLGFKCAVPPGWALLLLPRSGLGHKGLVLGNLIGLIDPDYRGEVMVSVWNRTEQPININRGDRIAQGLLVPYAHPVWQVVDSLPETERGEGGFNSTGA
jgi:dUTP pyrophosphatase